LQLSHLQGNQYSDFCVYHSLVFIVFHLMLYPVTIHF
jgi:hypothetical protein